MATDADCAAAADAAEVEEMLPSDLAEYISLLDRDEEDEGDVRVFLYGLC